MCISLNINLIPNSDTVAIMPGSVGHSSSAGQHKPTTGWLGREYGDSLEAPEPLVTLPLTRLTKYSLPKLTSKSMSLKIESSVCVFPFLLKTLFH